MRKKRYCNISTCTIYDYPRGYDNAEVQRRRLPSPLVFLLPFSSKPVRQEWTLHHGIHSARDAKGVEPTYRATSGVAWEWPRVSQSPPPCRWFQFRRQAALLNTGTGLDLAGTLTPYRGSGSSEPFGLTLAQQSRPSSRAHQAPFVVAYLHGAHGPERSLYTGRSSGSKGTITNGWSFISVISGELGWVRVRERLIWCFFVVVVRRGDNGVWTAKYKLDCRWYR